ncbi:Transposon Ty3-I Gag-Pol polyprotein, partial [Araneus ventricosus]
MYARSTIKPLTFDGQTSWAVFKTQFDVVSSTNGWTDFVKASQLVASLRGSAAEVLQGIPADKLTDLTTIEKALESRFGDSYLTQFYRTELKTEARRKLSSIGCRCGTTHEPGLRRVPYGCSGEFNSPVLRRRHQRRRHATFHQIDRRKRSEILSGCCWKEEHSSVRLERDLLEVQQEGARAEGVPGDYFEPGKLTHGCLAGRRLPSLNGAPEEGPRVSSLSGKKNGLYLEGSICGIQCLMLVDTGANVTLLRTDLAQKLKEQLIYTGPSISLRTATGEKTEIRCKLDASIE